ncbi:transglutaminaseTgpA domain-containing protein [Psychrobacter sp. I-STPA6b]|uniref:transglutaminase family protein n=1 Tax=Psychrobacter sp. I-STPA6b TaxID=2585718 RepID=UPI001D0C2334|nr:transglutaminase domain-containing protein [Psychrobacter sp. I-STPA6b]
MSQTYIRPNPQNDTQSSMQNNIQNGLQNSLQNQPQEWLLEDFAIHLWLSALIAVGFAGAVFGLFGIGFAVVMFIVAFVANFFSLNFAYEYREQKNALKQPADACAVLGLAVLFILLFAQGLIVALLGMLFFLQLALNLNFREHRQVYFGLIIAFVALMGGAVHTFSTGYLFFILLFCVFACFYLASVFVDKQRYLNPIDNNISQIANQHTGTNSNSQEMVYIGQWHYRERLIVAVIISAVAGFLYLATPHFSAGNLGSVPLKGFQQYENSTLEQQILPANADLSDSFYDEPTNSSGNNTGKQGQNNNAHKMGNKNSPFGKPAQPINVDNGANSSDGLASPDANNVNIGQSSWLDDSIYFYVKSERPRYLQNRTQTYFDGASWYSLQYGWKKLTGERQTYSLYPDKPNANIDIQVVKDNGQQHLLTTDNTVAVSFPNSWLATNYYDQVKAGKPLSKDTQYQLQVVDEYQHNRLIDRHQAKPDSKDLQLPNNLDPRIAKLSQQITAPYRNDWQKAQALESHLRNNYQYTLATLPNQNNIPLTDFLFGSKQGHCEYFATALAIMLRQQHIPARMITGYVAQDYNPITGYYEVKGTNGHAWVSAYIDGHWAVFEATGAYQPPNQNTAQQQAEQRQQAQQQAEQIAKQSGANSSVNQSDPLNRVNDNSNGDSNSELNNNSDNSDDSIDDNNTIDTINENINNDESASDNINSDSISLPPPQNTHTAIKDYLENINQQQNLVNDSLTENQHQLSWSEQLKFWAYQFWYQLILLLDYLIILLKKALWFVAIFAVIASGCYLLYRQLYNPIMDKIDLYRLKRLTFEPNSNTDSDHSQNEQLKTYLHQSMHLYQRMLTRHGVRRPRGQTIDQFSQYLQKHQLIDVQQQQYLSQMVNSNFYLTEPLQTATAKDTQAVPNFMIALYCQSLKHLQQHPIQQTKPTDLLSSSLSKLRRRRQPN